MQTDFLVIGSGVAGLTYAIKTAKAFRLHVFWKKQADGIVTPLQV